MKEKLSPLGRGVNALFSKIKSNAFATLTIDQIIPNPFQPRTNFSTTELEELAQSISEYGIIQPLTVRKIENEKYQIISGERRYRACKLSGTKNVPVYIKEVENTKMLELALIENIQRKDLDPIEIGISYQKLIDELSITQEKLAKKIGKKRSTISNYLRLLNLHPIIQAGLRDFILTIGHAKCLLVIENQDKQVDIYNYIISKNLSVRETEKIIKKEKHQKRKFYHKRGVLLSNELQKTELNLCEFLNTDVKIKRFKNGQGKMIIRFNSKEKLKEIINAFKS